MKEEEEAKQQQQQDTNHTKFAVGSLLSAGTVRDFDVSSVVVTVFRARGARGDNGHSVQEQNFRAGGG